MIELRTGADALDRTSAAEIRDLTSRATGATYLKEAMTAGETAFVEKIIAMSADCAASAASGAAQHFVAAFAEGRLAGFVIATVHAPDDRELDWLMVDPRFHGQGVAGALMEAGMAWLGTGRPMWLNVVRHNDRAIAFYRKHGFEIDRDTPCPKPMANWIMRRAPDGAG